MKIKRDQAIATILHTNRTRTELNFKRIITPTIVVQSYHIILIRSCERALLLFQDDRLKKPNNIILVRLALLECRATFQIHCLKVDLSLLFFFIHSLCPVAAANNSNNQQAKLYVRSVCKCNTFVHFYDNEYAKLHGKF